jgi:hypothetical protein
MKTIFLYGVRRSGNHFITSLILQHFTNYVHINDSYISYDQYMKYKDIEKYEKHCDHKWTGFKNVDCVLVSIENKPIEKDEVEKFKHIENCYFLSILRCPYTQLSSAWKTYERDSNRMREILKLWKLYANHFLEDDNQFIKISYDEFASNDDYIVDTIQKLGCTYNNTIDKNKTIKWQRSSFDAKSDKKAQVYKTLEDCIYKDDKAFVRLASDAEVKTLWEKCIAKIKSQKYN